MPKIEIGFTGKEFSRTAELLAAKLQLPLQRGSADYDFLLTLADSGLSLVPSASLGYGPISCDFATGANNHRRRFGGGNGQSIAKAVGVSGKFHPTVLDLTAGLGADGFVLASLGCAVTLVERNPIVHSLLADGLARAIACGEKDDALAEIINRIVLVEADSSHYLNNLDSSNSPDVVYLDPMFPLRKKSAKVKKEMQAFHSIVGSDADADSLLVMALSVARHRVVVKRPAGAPYLGEAKPSYSLEGKSTRFDIYALKKLPG